MTKTMKLQAALAAAAMLAATAASAGQTASAAWETGAAGVIHAAAKLKENAAASFRGHGDIDGSANMFPCPIGPYGPTNGSRTGSAEVSGDVVVQSDDGKAHGTIHVTGTIWLDGFCSNGMGGMVSGLGQVSGSGTVYGANGKALGTLKVSGSASVSGDGDMGVNVSGTTDVKGSL